jgi:DNA repair exonuclease SbcCD ATPase subunit
LKSTALNEKRVQTTLLDESLSRIDKMSTKIEGLVSTKKQLNDVFSPTKIKFIEKHSLSEIQERERAYHELDLVYEQTAQSRSRLRSDIEDARSRIKNYKGGACEHCSKVSYRIWELMNKDEKFIRESLQSLDECKREIDRLARELEKCEVPITVQDFEAIESLKNIDSELNVLRDHKKDQQKIKRKYMKDVSFNQKRYDLLKFWDVAFSEQGLVRYVIRNILSFFNERANYYMKFLTAGNFSIEFDETLKETVYLKDSLVYYESLSGGEKKKVSLSVMLALNDLLLLSGKSRANIVFFDEIADSLDDEGIKGIYELIKEVSEVKKMFIISHNDYLVGMIEDWADLLKVQKRKNITTIINKKRNAHV